MRLLLLNIILALVWMLMWGAFNAFTFIVGLVVGAVLLWSVSRSLEPRPYGSKIFRALRFALYFIRILVLANWQVAREVLRPTFSMTPRIIRYDVSQLSAAQTTALANIITLTPGTLTLDLSPDGKLLYIHCLFGADRDEVVRQIDALRQRMSREVLK